MKRLLIPTLALAGTLTACLETGTDPNCTQVPTLVTATRGDTVTTMTGLRYIETRTGSGATAQSCRGVSVKYVGSLTNGTRFDQGDLSFVPGTGSLIAGFEQGVVGMRVGGTRRLIIPPSLGYGSQANGPIPANSTLIFDLELTAAEN